MATTTKTQPTFRRAVLLMTATSFLVPAAGVLTAPILARALGTEGRGELAAAIAPAALILAVATLGLPDALTYYVAKHPRITRVATLWATLMTTTLGIVCLLVVWELLPFLSTGDDELGNLIVLATAFTIPALVVGVYRGAAVGRQMWGAVAVERIVNTSLRIAAFTALWLAGELTVLVAVLVSCLTPIVAGLVYWRLLVPAPHDDSEPPFEGGTLRTVLSFGSRVWLGSVASMLLARLAQTIMAPLSSVADLGLYTVAANIADVPLLVALAIQGALYGVNSRTYDPVRLTTTTRVTLLVGFLGCAVLGGTLPFWIAPLFGADFAAATVPTLMLLFSAILCIPGLMAEAGLSAAGRPGLRSLGFGVTLLAYTSVFVLLVPRYGVYGACWTSIIGNVVLTGFMVTVASRVMKLRVRDFLLPRVGDARIAWAEGLRLIRWARRRRAPETGEPMELVAPTADRD